MKPSRQKSAPSRFQPPLARTAWYLLLLSTSLLGGCADQNVAVSEAPSNEPATIDLAAGASQPAEHTPDNEQGTAEGGSKDSGSNNQDPQWISMFDGKSLNGWSVTNFGGEGDVSVVNTGDSSAIEMRFGAPMTGITFAPTNALPSVPRINYEVQLLARRTEGTDFFCGITLPYQDTYFSFIVGGWGGGLIGISSIDGYDASENETTDYLAIEDDRWYTVRCLVVDDRIQAWVDDKKYADVQVGEKKITTRPEVDLSKPFGIACFDTVAQLRDVKLREVAPPADP